MNEFRTLEDINDYIDFLNSRGKSVPQSILDQREQLEKESSIPANEFIFGTMASYNPYMTEQKEKVVREMTDQLMSTADNATQPCLLLGKVQCGKTDTFLSIMGLCFDRGIDVAVVLTKNSNALANQTLQRLRRDFRFFEDQHTYHQEALVSIYDVLDLGHRGGIADAQLNNPDVKRNKFIIVAKKEDTNLKYLIEIFEHSELLRSKKVLVCDDEADFASRNYYQRRGEIDLMKIAEYIEKFVTLPKFCRYLQITATPYSLYLQPDGSVMLRDGVEASPWLPRYTGLVPIHEKYIGGKQYYELSEDANSMYSCLFQPVEEKCIAILSGKNEFYLESRLHSESLKPLSYAVISYIFATAVRSLQTKKKTKKKYYSSCLIHCEVEKRNHAWQEELITGMIEDVRDAFLENNNSDIYILGLEKKAYDSLRLSNELGNKYDVIHEEFPTFEEVESEVKRFMERNDYIINVVNSDNPVSTMLNEKGQLRLEQTLNFFIGGNTLDRGITIDNMLCFFYGRNPQKFLMDTVLQHARMYGARDKEDMACTRFFTTEDIYDALKAINDIDSMMYDYLKGHRDTVQTNDFVSMVIGYDRRISASARCKYTPSNTKVIKPHQRILPIGFQTGEASEISDTISKIDRLIESCPDYSNVTDDAPFFLMPVPTAVEILQLIATTWRYGAEYENTNNEFDLNEMLTALDHCTFGGDGMIYCLRRTDRNMSRERIKSRQTNRLRWIDAPDDGNTDITPSRDMACERPVLMLLRENGLAKKGWRNTPFYWPVFMTQENVMPGIFTINSNKKFREPKKQLHLPNLEKYPKNEMFVVQLKKDLLMGIFTKTYKDCKFWINGVTKSLFLKMDTMGNVELVDSADPNKYYHLHSYNDGVFPYKIRDCKYIFIRTSMDFSGSQALFELDSESPYELEIQRLGDDDTVYNQNGEGTKMEDDSLCRWRIKFNLGNMLEQVLTPEDAEYLELLETQLDDELDTQMTDAEEIYIDESQKKRSRNDNLELC